MYMYSYYYITHRYMYILYRMACDNSVIVSLNKWAQIPQSVSIYVCVCVCVSDCQYYISLVMYTYVIMYISL